MNDVGGAQRWVRARMVWAISIAFALYTVVLHPSAACAQDEQPVDGRAAAMERAKAMGRNRGPNPTEKPGGEKSGEEKGEKAKEEGGDDEKKEDKKEKEEESSVKRPKKPPRVPDPREFDVLPDKNDRLRFSFSGQMWPDVLQWLAKLGNHSLDWQELPDDYINFTANRDYSLPEVRDLFNQLLFERGYTMILKGDVLLVSKIEKLDPSLLPRVEDESELLDLQPHEFVKITFQLPDKLKADTASEDVKPLLSRHAKVQPLMATNRLLVIDIVGNLRDVSRLVNTEHAAATGAQVPREFPIRFARADQVADQVMILLGLDPSSRRTPQELQVEQQKLQLFAQMQQRGKDVTKYLRKGDAPSVHLAVNYRTNSILANAPPEEMGIIERSVQMLDSPNGSLPSATSASLSMEKYQLVTLKPESILTTLEDIGDLDPRSRLKMDSDAKTVFAFATVRDHEKIKAMIDQLDGSGRELEVIWLRRLPADAVAATIQNLMAGEEEEEEQEDYSWYSRYRRKEEKAPKTQLRVDADIENNRLLLWVNQSELKEVRKFLAKLGEIPGESGNPSRVRVLDARDPESTLKLLEQLRLMWPSMGPNELRIEGVPSQPDDDSSDDDSEADPADSATPTAAVIYRAGTDADGLQIAWADGAKLQAGLAEAEGSNAATNDNTAPDDTAPNNTAPNNTAPNNSAPAADSARNAHPITISVNDQGQLIISSRDTEALDRLEDLVARIAAPAKDYEVFYLENALASLVTLNLDEYFEEEDEKSSDSQDRYWRDWYGMDYGNKTDTGTKGLAKRRKIRFIYDYDTNSILVTHASPDQLNTVRSLIEVYDKPPSDDSISARRFQIYKIKHARADDVATTIKDVYRDLLSSKDKVFDKNKGGEKEQSSQTTNYYRVYGSGDDDKKPKKIRASFAGALSVGVDKISNTVIVSAQEEWIPSIAEMIEYLDTEAEPYKPTIEVVNTKVDAKAVHAALARAFGQSGKVPEADKPPEQRPPGDEAEMARAKREARRSEDN